MTHPLMRNQWRPEHEGETTHCPGANGAGKSNFTNLFRLLNEMVEQQLQLYVQKQGGTDAVLHFGRSTRVSRILCTRGVRFKF